MDMICEVSRHQGWTKSKFTFGSTPEKETTYKRGEHTVHVVFMSDVKAEILLSSEAVKLRDSYIKAATEAAEFVAELNDNLISPE